MKKHPLTDLTDPYDPACNIPLGIRKVMDPLLEHNHISYRRLNRGEVELFFCDITGCRNMHIAMRFFCSDLLGEGENIKTPEKMQSFRVKDAFLEYLGKRKDSLIEVTHPPKSFRSQREQPSPHEPEFMKEILQHALVYHKGGHNFLCFTNQFLADQVQKRIVAKGSGYANRRPDVSYHVNGEEHKTTIFRVDVRKSFIDALEKSQTTDMQLQRVVIDKDQLNGIENPYERTGEEMKIVAQAFADRDGKLPDDVGHRRFIDNTTPPSPSHDQQGPQR